MNHFAMLTSASAAGKTTDAVQIAAELGCGLLHNDEEIACRTFKALKHDEHCKYIGIPEKWSHLYDVADVDRLFRLHHRDWIARNPQHRMILAEGWMYCLPQHRQQVYDGLRKLTDEWRFALIRYFPPFEERTRRYLKRHQEPLVKLYGTDEGRKLAHAEEHLQKSIGYFTAPGDDEPVVFADLKTKDEVVAFLRRWIAAG
ncbi:MAG: hypothetical protein U0791_26805 [Gemmataceae bacterium]